MLRRELVNEEGAFSRTILQKPSGEVYLDLTSIKSKSVMMFFSCGISPMTRFYVVSWRQKQHLCVNISDKDTSNYPTWLRESTIAPWIYIGDISTIRGTVALIHGAQRFRSSLLSAHQARSEKSSH